MLDYFNNDFPRLDKFKLLKSGVQCDSANKSEQLTDLISGLLELYFTETGPSNASLIGLMLLFIFS